MIVTVHPERAMLLVGKGSVVLIGPRAARDKEMVAKIARLQPSSPR